MKKIEQLIGAAFAAGKPKSSGNTACTGDLVALHGNAIVKRDAQGKLSISLAGWPTVTTRSRINAMLKSCGAPYRVFQARGEQWLWNERTAEKATMPLRDWVTLES